MILRNSELNPINELANEDSQKKEIESQNLPRSSNDYSEFDLLKNRPDRVEKIGGNRSSDLSCGFSDVDLLPEPNPYLFPPPKDSRKARLSRSPDHLADIYEEAEDQYCLEDNEKRAVEQAHEQLKSVFLKKTDSQKQRKASDNHTL